MAVKRKSNWYIYLIAFGLTIAMIVMAIFSFRNFLFPETRETGLTENGVLTEDFVPDKSMNLNVLTMISDGDSDMPELFIIASYNAVENRLTFIPLTNGITLKSAGRSLPNIFAAQGGEGAGKAVSDECGITIDGYIRFSRSSLVDFFTIFGNVEYEVAKTTVIKDGSVIDPINSGKQIFTAEKMFRYIMFAEFDEGESYRYNMICSMLIDLVNQNVTYIDSSLLDRYAAEIMENAETNITEERYLKSKAAMLNTVQYGINPAEYYVPYGEYNDDGSFTISDNSVTTIRQKAGEE